MDLLQIHDSCCAPSGGMGTIRLSNLARNSDPMDLLLADGRTVFADVVFKETTAFKRIYPGGYQFLLAHTDLEPVNYTIFLLSAGTAQNAVQTLVAEDR